jgi:hypothetical protein
MRYEEGPIRYLNKDFRHIGGLSTLKNLNISGYHIARLSTIILQPETKDVLTRIPVHRVNAVNGNQTNAVGEKLVRLGVAVVVRDLDIRICDNYTWRVGPEAHCWDESHDCTAERIRIGIAGRTKSELELFVTKRLNILKHHTILPI